ncbi:hypothetical protein TorRG33x02_321890 [Trema orientale]|uniref:Putative plant transposon protein domain-containing protein n=1 Tax=Trema orientale TaxID=63057 RepID=A0A2P5BGJ5_TREOI|nr:hypothetical protein TorRG33x02_321890 [Trema orientale]
MLKRKQQHGAGSSYGFHISCCTMHNGNHKKVVWEFYANALEAKNGKVYVRGKRVTFDSAAINQYFSTPDFETDGYSEYLDSNPDIDEVATTFCGQAQNKADRGDEDKPGDNDEEE